MTEGSIVRQIIMFSLPLMLGNIFQMLYNTVDSIVVGNFVGKEALAAVGSTTMIVNMLVFFFNGFSIGAGVIIGQRFGAKDMKNLHTAVETTMAMTFLFCIIFTIVGILGVKPMLRFMDTPEDVFEDAVTYLTIYFAGISGLLIYNMGSGILRAVGDSTRPLMFLVFTSILNTVLDLIFVIFLKAGIAGVAWATIISQAVSAVLTLLLLTRTKDIYKLVWKDLKVDLKTLKAIFSVGLPAGIQSVITAFSNIFVQSYVNYFGSSVMAGWSSYNKLDTFIMLPMQSMAMAATTFVSQNIGAGQEERANKGTIITIIMSVSVTAVVALGLFFFAEPAVGLFSKDQEVIEAGALFLHANVFFLLFNCVNHVLASALRGRGDSRGPMIIMLTAFVGIRQLYLFLATRFIGNTPFIVGFGYPVGWAMCFFIEVTYYYLKHIRGKKKAAPAAM
ncbi:MAG: MATE family efflux transporter [Lachnospiraceae bacterium]|nr:MATE family efflux transporter [Lachnospiraceae bacterium]